MKKIGLDKRGFTLIELLVAVTVLGIILIIALPRLSSLQSDNRKRKYDKYADSLLASGKLYTDSYSKDMFGNNPSGCYEIPYSELKEKNLAKDIKFDEVNCDTYGSDGTTPLTYVKVLKTNEDYYYDVAIKCVDKNENTLYEKTLPARGLCDGTTVDEKEPTIIITPDGHDLYNGKKSGVADKVTIRISDLYGLAENTKIKYAWLKNGSSERSLTFETKDFKNKRGAGRISNPITTTIEVPQGVTGEYRLVIKAENIRDTNGIYMSQATVKSKVFKLDNTKPTIINKYNNKDGVWTDSSVKISATGSDAHSGVSKIYYTYSNSYASMGYLEDWDSQTQSGKNLSVVGTWTAERNKRVYLIAVDKAGNKSSIYPAGKVMIDRTNPKCTITGGSTNWTKENRNVTVKCSDGSGSGCKVSSYSDTVSTTTKTKTYTVEDKAGRKGTCEANIYVDKIAPTCSSVTNTSTTWRNKPQTITQYCSDNDSQCAKNFYANTYSNNQTSGTYIYDKAGNKNYCSYDVYVDTTPPYSPFVEVINPSITITSGDATTAVLSYSCSKNIEKTHETNMCTVNYKFDCHTGGDDGLCWVTYRVGDITAYTGIAGSEYWDYRSSKYGPGCPNGVFQDWNPDGYGSKNSNCKSTQTINELRVVDKAGNVGGILQVTYNFSR